VVSASADDASQSGYAYRFDWGLDGLHALAPSCDVIVVIDVLRFTSAVSVAVDTGATVFPFRWKDARAASYATERNAQLAGLREDGGPSLSPTDLAELPPATRIVLPSPNGSTISLTAAEDGVPFVLAGSLRNATATARRARALSHDGAVGVIAAGERWGTASGPVRPALEDLLGAGAVLAALDPSAAVSDPRCSPEAAAARAAFVDAKPTLTETLVSCASGRELVARGWLDDVGASARLDASDRAAQLVDDAFESV
jgi:2-phosphosulfolactate phosphatase